ncbi:MAG: ABC transporter permease [Ruminococcus sp.]|nr:ABC transporter permease [Ruminococcus sp.]
MFLHNLKYELKTSLRVKEVIFWLVIFPIAMGLFFKLAFDGIYEKTTKFSPIPVAVVEGDNGDMFRDIADGLQNSDGQPLMKITYTDEDEAMKLLEEGKVDGIIYTGLSLKLTVSSEGMSQTILKSFVDQYDLRVGLVMSTVASDPALKEALEKQYASGELTLPEGTDMDALAEEYSGIGMDNDRIDAVMDALSADISSNVDVPLTEGNTDNMIQYFYNLIAMVALFGSLTGLHVATDNQANLSAMGQRKGCSPTPKSLSLLASLIGSFVVQTICMVICVTFLRFVLGIDLGSGVRLLLVYAAAIFGGILGVCAGFMVGSFGRMSLGAKTGICTSVSMLCCFLSGLMVGNMKTVIEKNAPIVNRINPAAVVSDCFYCLNIYSDYRRFTEKLITMAVISALFFVIGTLLTRRRKYASL